MSTRTFIGLLILSFLGICSAGAQQRADLNLQGRDASSVFDYLADGTFSGTNGMVVIYGGTRMSADVIRGDQKSGLIIAEGEVLLQKGTNVWSGERLEYNYLNEDLAAGSFRTGHPPIFAAGEMLAKNTAGNSYTTESAFITTDDHANPGHRIRAEKMTIVPGDYVEAKNAVLYLGEVPVFYFPYLRRSLKADSNHFDIIPGYRSKYGPYLLGTYNWTANEQLSGNVHLDYRYKRGVGTGPEFDWNTGRWGKGHAGFYYLNDSDPEDDDDTGRPIKDDRYILEFSHRLNLRTNLTGKVVVNRQSDAQVMKEFFESKYRDYPQPPTFLELNQTWPNYSLSLLTQPQLNRFFETVERLPDVKLSAIRQQLGSLPLYYEGESSAAYLKRRFADENNQDFSAFRGDSYHQIVYPNTFFGWLNVTPRAGGRFTYYSEAHGDGATTDEETRAVFNTGAEVSFKASRTWKGIQNGFLDMDGLRHILRPSLNYVYIPSPNAEPLDLPQFDYETDQLRLPPILFPDYNMLDSIDSQNVVRMGLWNTLHTKRNAEIDDLMIWGIYTDWRINRQRDQSTFGDLFSDLEIKPRDWLTLGSEIRYDLENHRLRLTDHRLTLSPNSRWSLAFGHRYIRNDDFYGPGNNLFTNRIYYRINDNWGTRVELQYEAQDGTLEEQQYTVYRDLRSWTAALTFRVRNDDDEPTDYGVALTVSLKSFPRFSLGDDINKPSLLLGY